MRQKQCMPVALLAAGLILPAIALAQRVPAYPPGWQTGSVWFEMATLAKLAPGSDNRPLTRAAVESEFYMRGEFLKVGHRGASGVFAENTLAAFAGALEQGAHMVELDVRLSSDGQLVVIHDDSVDRTTDGTGKVAEMTLAELQKLDAGGGEKIPSLGEVLLLLGTRCGVNVELKGPGTVAPVAGLLSRFVREQEIPWDNFLVSSFDHAQLAELREIEPRIRRAPLFGRDLPDDFIAIAHGLGAWSVNLNARSITADLVDRCHREGLRVHVYTVNDPRAISRLKALGVDGLIGDYPDRL